MANTRRRRRYTARLGILLPGPPALAPASCKYIRSRGACAALCDPFCVVFGDQDAGLRCTSKAASASSHPCSSSPPLVPPAPASPGIDAVLPPSRWRRLAASEESEPAACSSAPELRAPLGLRRVPLPRSLLLPGPPHSAAWLPLPALMCERLDRLLTAVVKDSAGEAASEPSWGPRCARMRPPSLPRAPSAPACVYTEDAAPAERQNTLEHLTCMQHAPFTQCSC